MRLREGGGCGTPGCRQPRGGPAGPRQLLLSQLEQEERTTIGKWHPKLRLVGFLFPRNF